MKHLLKLVFLLIAVEMVISCKKDDNNTSTRKEGALYFKKFSETETLLWVGGEKRSPENINFKKLLQEDSQSWISPSYYYGGNYFFDGDTIELGFDESISRMEYKFSNDSLFYYRISNFGPSGYWQYGGMGNENEIRTKQGMSYVRTYREDGSVKKGEGFDPGNYKTVESMIGNHEFQGIDQMGPNDTLLLHNQTKLYK